jgi:hypothetical protein
MGLYGILVVTTAPVTTTTPATVGTAYPAVGATPAVTYSAEIPLLFSEIDPVQNNAVNAAVTTTGFSETMVWSGQPGGCGNPSSATFHQCYPPVVNYTPLYYTINGVAFNKTNAPASLFPTSPATGLTAGTGNVLVRLVNAGLRMHVPSIVGSQTGTAVAPAVPPNGFSIIAEDGNRLPGVPKVQNDVFMAAGKTYDVMINVPAAPAAGTTATALPVYDRELSLSGNAIGRDAGMLAYIGINGAGLPTALTTGMTAVARADTYPTLVAGQTFTVSDPSKGVIANDTNVYGVHLLTAPASGAVTLNANGTFTYIPTGTGTSDSFTYCANGSVTGTTCSSGITATVTLSAATIEAASGITCTSPTAYTANTATYLVIKTPGVLATCKDAAGYPLTVNTATITATGATVLADINGGFTASVAAAGTYAFTFQAKNSQGTSSAPMTVNLTFPAPSNLAVTVLDGYDKKTPITDYRWVIEEDRTFYVNPNCQTNTTTPPAGCPTVTGTSVPPTFGVNFHTSYMPYVAQGCTGPLSCEGGQKVVDPATGTHNNAVCDIGNGVCRPDTTGNGLTAVMPSQVVLDPSKRYYISVLPGDAANPFAASYTGAPNCAVAGQCGHGMGGAPIPIACTPAAGLTTCTGTFAPVTVLSQPTPNPPGKLSVFVFEDDFPLNGEQDGGGGIDVLSPNEPGLGGFQIHLWDAMGGNGDFTGQMTYDMFNMPLSNSLAGTIDPLTQFDACPISTSVAHETTGANGTAGSLGMTGMIVTCPKYESDGKTLSPLAGQAVVANLMPGRWGVIATPGADRIARGEEWLQTNTLDGQKAHDSFTRIGEPSYFQEFGPAGYHVSIGFANPAIINGRHAAVCNGTDPNITGPNCNNTLTGRVTGERLSRTPDERLYSSGSHDAFYWTQCFVSFGDPDGEDFAFTKCNADGTFTLKGLPDGDWRITTFDQWNDQLVDGLSTPVRLSGGATGATTNLGDIASTQWQTNLYTRTFIDDNKDGVSQATEAGIPFLNVAVRLRDGSLENLLLTDFTGTANFNESFPLFSWYTVETDTTRYKNTGTHVVYDAGGPADGTLTTCGGTANGTGYPPCGTSTIGKFLANTIEQVSVPTNLRVPGAVYCSNADCTGFHINTDTGGGPSASAPPSVCTTSSTGATTCSTKLSTGRIDPPSAGVEGWQGFPGQNNFLEFGKTPYAAATATAPAENGGIKGHVIYASTRPFDDPMMLVQTQWEPLVPHVTINLYKEGFAADDVTPTLKLVDTTQTSSFDDWAQGFRSDGMPNMNCPGQGGSTGPIPDLFFFTLFNQPNYLNTYNTAHGVATPNAPAGNTLPANSQFKCYDGMHNWNQIQPAPYDGMYQFPSVTSVSPTTGRSTGTNCDPAVCIANPDTLDPFRLGTPMLPSGKYVVEVVLPPGFELVKEEDKNILIGDNFIAPVTQQFAGFGNVFILPDQASVASAWNAGYNANSAQNSTNSFGTSPANGIVPGFVPEPVWPCVGEARIVPDYISLYPQTKQVAPFAGATRRLCDRKEVTLGDQMGAIAKFFIYTSTHIASKFTGGITDDYTSEFDPFSPQFGEKFSPPSLPVSIKDWTGNEVSRVYADQWGSYDGMTYSTWEVNPPNPTGYSPTMMVVCMNDPGPIPNPANPAQMITDPAFTQGYSQFCYELPFMPGTTQYLDTPVVPTSAFAGAGYNNVDCYYPTLTPAVSEVDGDGVGPYVSASGHTLTITALGDQMVPNYAYSGPSATASPFNAKSILRHYGFGTQCTSPTASSTTCNTKSSVTIGGVAASITNWSDTAITATVPSGVPNCAIQQQTQYGGSTAQCGALVITAGNGKQSIDTVTVTVGGKAPTHVAATGSIQSAIDAAAPGDLIIVDPTCIGTTGPTACTTAGATTNTAGAHNELLLMWKPVRLQGVGGATSIINANTHPAGKLDNWRREVNCLFGLALDGTPISTTHPFDSTNTFTCGANMAYFNAYGGSGDFNPQIDRLPLEATVGWDANLNGNLAELLQEPSLMGALEGAGITVLSKGVNFPSNPFDSTLLAGFPAGTTLLTAASCGPPAGPNPFPSNFWCNPSRIDGLGITNSSQGGGGIFVHGWGHNLEIANNRIYNNAGTLSGGINVGQGEFPPGYLQGSATNAPPGSCETSFVPNAQLPYCHDLNVNVHNNAVILNSSIGDELFSATPAGAGGVSFCTGSDYYKFNYNWVCGNLSSGDGGGLGHLGYSKNGDIEHNSILFNQSLNPTIPANGGGIIVMGAPDVDPPCGATTDADCVPPLGSVGPSDGVGPNLVINANLIMGNAAEAGTGGGIAFQNVNGSEVVAFPTTPALWSKVTVTNNIIANNVAGWDGGGISLEDALNVDIVNNTIITNNSTATAGVLFTTIGGPLASQQGTNCMTTSTTSCPQPAGLVSVQNSAVLGANLPATITCPANHGPGGTGTGGLTNGACRSVSYPLLANNVFWQNSSYYVGVGALSPQFQQNVITLYNAFTATKVASQTATGACVPASAGTHYWDIGVRGDTGPTNHSSTFTLNPQWSVLTSATGYAGNNLTSNPNVIRQYCNGARTPPEACGPGGCGWNVPPGISDATVPNPVFNLTPVATVDEGNNWINLRWGPLSVSNPVTGATLGNYALALGSPAIDHIPTTSPTYGIAPSTDFFGNPRPDVRGTGIDVGAVEHQNPPVITVISASLTPATWSPSAARGVGAGTIPCVLGGGPCQVFALTNTGNVPLTGIAQGVLAGANAADYSIVRLFSTCGPAGGGQLLGQTTLAPGVACVVTVQFHPLAGDPANSIRSASLSVTDLAGTQTSTLSGTAR